MFCCICKQEKWMNKEKVPSMYTRKHIHAHTHICMHARTHTHTHTHTLTNTHTHSLIAMYILQ